MLHAGVRRCDVCGEVIVAGAPYRLAILAPEVAASLLDVDNPDLVPTWTQQADFSVRLEVCLECYLEMGDLCGTVEMR